MAYNSRNNYYRQAPPAPVPTRGSAAPAIQQEAANAINITNWLDSPTVRRKFTEVLDKGANGFISSLLSLVKSSKALQEADGKTIMAAAMTAATLKLPINPNLGLAYIVPYKNKGKMEAQFQIGYKGFIQLAERTGQYKTINANVVYEGQIEDIDFITGEIVRGKKISNTVVGYVAYIKFINGFEKTLYMTKEEVEAHATKYSQAYRSKYGPSGPWKDNFDAMGVKTVIKLLIAKYGIMSIDTQTDTMNTAIKSDQAVIRDEEGGATSYDYVDNDQPLEPDADIITVDMDMPQGEPEPPQPQQAPLEPQPQETAGDLFGNAAAPAADDEPNF